jgi:hypothetical protein
VIVCVGLSLLRDPFNRESIFDPRLNEGRWSWCVIRFEKDSVELYNMITITSLLHYIIPFIINIIAPVSILVNVSHIKSTTSLQSSSERTINCVQTISPIVLIIFALPRLMFFLLSLLASRIRHLGKFIFFLMAISLVSYRKQRIFLSLFYHRLLTETSLPILSHKYVIKD